jgi:hypothetical protein
MPQRIIIEPFQTKTTGFTPEGYEFASSTAIGKALEAGWRIVHVTSAPVPELSTVYITFVVEKSVDTGSSGSY